MTDEANHVASNVSMKITLHMFIYAHHYIYSAIYNTVLHLVVIIKKVKLFSIACVRAAAAAAAAAKVPVHFVCGGGHLSFLFNGHCLKNLVTLTLS